MKLYTIKKLLLLMVTALSLVSCRKWLDVKPSTQFPNEDLFKTESGFAQAMAGVYTSISSTGLYGRELTFGALDVLAGYYQPGNIYTTTYYKFFTQYPYKRDNASKDDACVAMIDGLWLGLYHNIANINNVLQWIDNKKDVFSGENYHIIKGEAIGLRAFLHLDLLRMYGPAYIVNPNAPSIPFVDSLSSLVTRLSTVNEAADRIIEELQNALSLMENDPIRLGTTPPSILGSARSSTTLAVYHNRRYHFNYYAVAATLARAYLWKGDKENALKYAKLVIQDQATRFPWVLDANLTAITNLTAANKDRTFTTEHIFALNIRDMENYIPDHFASASIDQGIYLPTTSARRNAVYESNTVDPRNQYMFTAAASNFYCTKLIQEDVVSLWFKYQMPMIRITEMYYIAAECEPVLSDGLAWLNVVRAARKLSLLTSSTVSTSATLNTEIMKEYQKEFICEGQTWFYYKRRDLSSIMNTNFASRNNKLLYVFDMPEEEFLYGGRN